jgi:RNA polymerase sigma-70 factor (ECF subfamily)
MAHAGDGPLKGLVEGARKGDGASLAELVRLTWPATYRLAQRLTGDDQHALDVAQEAYLRALRALPRFRGEARFSTWMYRVTANCASDHMARVHRSRHEKLDTEGEGGPGDLVDQRPEHDPEAWASSRDERAQLAAALMRLPWKLRQVVVLRDVYDLPHREIAERLGTSEAAAKVRLQRARKRLREDLARTPAAQAAGHGRRRARRATEASPGEGTVQAARRVVGVDDDAVAS